ncbi:FAD-dependent 2-octaprenylphenol hydroxylase [Shewanella hanedai]|uniref:FAD-dependent oxidoreductase n=1 Tax=Shewanella hanedai TaxID=25 RepID=A0A553JSK9_SHEHA|nr:FAD-dependent oxidoreductase [Shewanella hanedai]TRY15447.1 FAD-dependent oxidoreductase [Shewanella hanedai]GGI79884.1 FAD-dependent 2-octaprenylphenol hydroxylase [Shewanella hanedai]
MLSTKTYDVAIVGGGMVGLATAVGLAMENFRVVVIDAGETPTVTGEPKLRVSAINKASQRLLQNIGAWAYLDDDRLSPYQKMDVWDKDSIGKISFDAHSLSEQYLGSIIENDNIAHALSMRAAEFDEITHIENHALDKIAFGEREAWLTLDNGENISAALVIGADGANSWVREQCKIPMTFWDYGHHAIVATVRTEIPHQDTARQVFLKDGPLAFLPLYEPNFCSIVWSVPPAKAKQLLESDSQTLERTLTAEFDGRMGMCKLECEPQAFPLRMRYARHFGRHRLFLAGDAAHTIHPLAGQGVNLGLLDAAAIIQTLGELKLEGKDIGDYANLRSLERWRKADALEMIAAMEGFKRLFEGSNPVKKALRDFGLNLVDNIAPVKTLFMQQAMGNKNSLPKLCKAQ